MTLRLAAAAMIAVAGLTAALAQEPPAPPVTEPVDSTGSVDRTSAAPAPAPPDWAGAPVVSADGVKIGKVESVETGANGEPVAVMAEVGGFLGFGASTVRLPVGAANFDGEEVRIGMVETDVQSLVDGDREGLGVAPE